MAARGARNGKTIHHGANNGQPFTRILNDAIRDESLSFKARGLLTFILSHAEDWQVTVQWLSSQAPEGAHSVTHGIKELEDAGYLRRDRFQDENGHWVTVVRVSDDRAALNRLPENRPVGNRPLGEWAVKQKTVKKTIKKTSSPRTKSEVHGDSPTNKDGHDETSTGVKDAATRVVTAWQQAAKGNTGQSPNEIHRLAVQTLNNGADEHALIRAITLIVDDGEAVKDFRITKALAGTYKRNKSNSIHYAADRKNDPSDYSEDLTPPARTAEDRGYYEDL